MRMEACIVGKFPNRIMAERSAAAVRDMGIMDLKLMEEDTLSVYVEKSRYRQIEDAFTQFGGEVIESIN